MAAPSIILAVHGWVDAHRVSNLDRIAAAVRAHGVDVLALQETFGGVTDLAARCPGFLHVATTGRGVALLSRFPLTNPVVIQADTGEGCFDRVGRCRHSV